jgi:hypothetical protein
MVDAIFNQIHLHQNQPHVCDKIMMMYCTNKTNTEIAIHVM